MADLAGEPIDDWRTYIIRGDDRECWYQLKAITTALNAYPDVSELLHGRDAAHLILRATLDGANPQSSEVETSIAVVSDLIVLLQTKAEAARLSRTTEPNA